RIGHRFEEGERHLEIEVLVPSARFEQQHVDARVLAQPRRDYAARAPRADDDVIETFSHPLIPLLRSAHPGWRRRLAALLTVVTIAGKKSQGESDDPRGLRPLCRRLQRARL